MDYLKEPQYYEDLYDLHTIETCLDALRIFKKVKEEGFKRKELKYDTEEEKERAANYACNLHLLGIELNRYKQREEIIKEWVERDRAEQDKYDNTPPPEAICDKCNKPMASTSKHLHSNLNEPLRVLFFYDCKKCKTRKAFYDDGEEFKSTPNLCPQCGSELKTNYEHEGEVSTWIEKCTKCSYKDVDVTDHGKWRKEQAEKEKRGKELLAKYRSDFCLSKEKAEEWISTFEEFAFAKDVYEYELQKYDDPVYEKVSNLKKFGVAELEKLLSDKLKNHKYHRLTFDKPEIGQFVVIPFTLQDTDSSRNGQASTKELEKLIKPLLQGTNWRLMSEGVSYRLGYVSGRLKGYERDEDLQELLGKKKEKPKKQLDPEMEKKYGNSNTAKLSRLFAEHEATERIRKKRLELEPDGFLLEDSEGGGYMCNLCYKGMPGRETWWNLDGVTCMDCHRNIMEGIIPAEVMRNRKICLSSWELKDEFRLHYATIRKLTRNGELIGRQLKDINGKTYHTVYMVAENVEFLKSHPRKSAPKQRWYFVQKDGEVVWL